MIPNSKKPHLELKRIRKLHYHVKKQLKNPKICDFCKKVKKVELANKSHKYKNSVLDWYWLCKKCHHDYDYRVSWGKNISKSKTGIKRGPTPNIVKIKISKAKKGTLPWNTGLKHSKKTREKMSRSHLSIYKNQ